MNFSSLRVSAAKRRMPSDNFSVAIWSSFSIQRNALSSSARFCSWQLAAGFRTQLACERARGLLHFFEQRRADGEQVATGQLENFFDVAETGAHDLGRVAVFFVIVVNARDRQHTGVFGRRIGIAPRRFFMPVEDAADE